MLLLPFFYWILLHARSLCFMSRADITRAPSLLLPVSLSLPDIPLPHYTTCVSESWRNMQSVDAYTMFMAWTLAPHMVDTQSQTALFKSVIPVPGTPNESLVNRNVILWDDARYFQKSLDQAYHGDCSHATASSGAWYPRRTERTAVFLYPALKRHRADRSAGRTRTCSS